MTTNDETSPDASSRCEIPPRPQEQLLIDLLAEISAARILCTSAGLAQFAQAAARRIPHAHVTCHYPDIYLAGQARRTIGSTSHNLAIHCAADFPQEAVDLVALPISAQGEAELTRDWMQSGYQLLGLGGRMLASTDNPHDKWLHAEMGKLFDTVTCRPSRRGVVYLGTKRGPLNRIVDFTCQFALRDRGRLISLVSRPGVFSHRRVDPGARQLLNAMEVHEGQRVLDIGCGCGTVTLAAACRASGVHVHAVDSSARAVQCVHAGAALNGLTNVSTELNASGDYEGQGHFDLVLANPPYYANFQIAELFLRAGHASLRGGGRILLVTKWPEWYREHMPQWYDDVRLEASKGYHIIHGLRPLS